MNNLGYILPSDTQLLSYNGKPLIGGHLEIYNAGTNFKYISYSDFDGTQNPFSITIPHDGRIVAIGEVSLQYDYYVYDSYRNLVFSRKNVTPIGFPFDEEYVDERLSELEESIVVVDRKLEEEKQDRISSEDELNASITNERTDRIIAIDSEKRDRGRADNNLAGLITQEQSARIFNDNLEINTRTANVAALNAEIERIDKKTVRTDGTTIIGDGLTTPLQAVNIQYVEDDGVRKELIANQFSTSASYKAGEIVFYNGYLYKAKKNVSPIQNINLVDWDKVSISDVSKELQPARNLTESTSDPQFAYTIVDVNNVPLFTIDNEGNVEWCKGVPEPVKTWANDHLVKAEDGKSLIQSEVAQALSNIDDEKCFYRIIDKNGIELFSISKDGEVNWQKGIPEPIAALFSGKDTVNKVFADAMTNEYSGTDIYALTDREGHVLFEINSFGEVNWQKGMPEPIADKFRGKDTCDYEYANSVGSKKDNEFIWAITDENEAVVLGVRDDGTIAAPKLLEQIESASVEGLATKEYVDDSVKTEHDRAVSAEAELSDAINNINPTVVVGGSNNPDNIFLTSIGEPENEVLTFKNHNRITSGYNLVYVRPSDVLSEVMVTDNTIYEIDFSHNISDETLVIPENCIIRFNGGCLANGSIEGNNTKVEYKGECFKNVKVLGTWNIPYISSDITDNIVESLHFCNDDIYSVFHIKGKHNWTPAENDLKYLEIPSNTKVIIDGTLTVNTNGFTNYALIGIEGKTNVEICGGKLVGDVDTHDYTTSSTHEWGFGVHVRKGSTNVNIHNMEICNMTGDGVYGNGNNFSVHDCKIYHCGRQGVSYIIGTNAQFYNLDISDIFRVLPKAAIDCEPNPGDGYSKNISIHDIKMEKCCGLQQLHCRNVEIDNIQAKDCNVLFFGRDSKDIFVKSINSENYSMGGNEFIYYEDGCENIVMEDLNEVAEIPVTIKWKNVKLKDTISLSGTIIEAEQPAEGSMIYDKGTHNFRFFNGTEWKNI